MTVNDLPSDDSLEDGASSKDSSRSNSPNEDWKKRFDGVNSLYGKTRKQLEKLRADYDQMATDYERQLSETRRSTGDVDTRIKDFEKQLDEANKAKASAERELNQFKSKDAVRSVIREKYSALAEAFEAGDLRNRTEFNSDEDYHAYLDRMAKRIVPVATATDDGTPEDEETDNSAESLQRQRRQFLASSLPSTSLRGRNSSQKKTMQQLTDELEKATPGTKDYDSIVTQMDDLLR